MEENIKILENLKENVALFSGGWRPILKQEEIQAIENLLKAYKELEEYYEEQNEVNAKFIPKSKIKEKIEKLKKELQEYEESDIEQDEDYLFDVNALMGEIQVLQELLED